MTRDPAEFGWHCWNNTAPSPVFHNLQWDTLNLVIFICNLNAEISTKHTKLGLFLENKKYIILKRQFSLRYKHMLMKKSAYFSASYEIRQLIFHQVIKYNCLIIIAKKKKKKKKKTLNKL